MVGVSSARVKLGGRFECLEEGCLSAGTWKVQVDIERLVLHLHFVEKAGGPFKASFGLSGAVAEANLTSCLWSLKRFRN